MKWWSDQTEQELRAAFAQNLDVDETEIVAAFTLVPRGSGFAVLQNGDIYQFSGWDNATVWEHVTTLSTVATPEEES